MYHSRRATALEATGEVKEALRDYKRAVELSPALPDAVAGVARCETVLGIRPAARKNTTSNSTSVVRGGSGGDGGAGTMTAEDKKLFVELQDRVREVALAKMRATEQFRNATAEKRKADLTISQVTPLPHDRPVYTSLGRMFVRSPRSEVLTHVQAAGQQAERKTEVCKKTLAHLESQEKEADAAFQEFVAAITRRMGGPVRVG
jgi:chaperonin cofactor prefoldin